MPARILIIDDYEDNGELLRVMPGQAGYVVSEARGRKYLELDKLGEIDA